MYQLYSKLFLRDMSFVRPGILLVILGPLLLVGFGDFAAWVVLAFCIPYFTPLYFEKSGQVYLFHLAGTTASAVLGSFCVVWLVFANAWYALGLGLSLLAAKAFSVDHSQVHAETLELYPIFSFIFVPGAYQWLAFNLLLAAAFYIGHLTRPVYTFAKEWWLGKVAQYSILSLLVGATHLIIRAFMAWQPLVLVLFAFLGLACYFVPRFEKTKTSEK